MKNLKIGYKLLLSFAALLLVFIVSVFMMWSYFQVAEKSSEFLVSEVVPSLQLSEAFNSVSYEIFLATSTMQYKEDQASIAIFHKKLAEGLQTLAEMDTMNKNFPKLKGPEYIMHVVAPMTKQYIEVVDHTLSLMTKKRDLLDNFEKIGNDASDAVAKVLSEIIIQIKDDAKRGIDSFSINSMLDTVALSAALQESAMAVRQYIWQIAATDDTDGMKKILEKLENMRNQAEALKPFLVTSEGKNAISFLQDILKNYNAELDSFLTTYLEIDKLDKRRAPLMESFSAESSAAFSISANLLKEVSNSGVQNLKHAILVMFWATLGAVVLGLLISFVVSKSISKPLNSIVAVAQRAGEGDLRIESKDFGYEGKDEMGTLVNAIFTMISAQEKTLYDTVAIAKSLTDGAINLSTISDETNASMEGVKASIDQISALSESNSAALEVCNSGIDEMSAGADTVARSATDSAAFIAQTTNASNKAIQTVDSVISGMRNVNNNSKESEAKTRQLVTSVENVSSFVSVITGIADQTNLLALNAAIEAARAGEVGRGFAVVAEEVRKLAEESARAAQNVNEIIAELQKGAHDSIDTTTEAARVLEATLIQAEAAQKELDVALKQMNQANDSIQNIAAVAEEQAASSKEVASAIDNATKSTVEMVSTITSIRKAADETADTAQNVAEYSEAMTGYAQALTETLSHFKLRNLAEPASKNVKTSKNIPALKAAR